MSNAVAAARRAIALLDLTELGDAATEAQVRALCGKAQGEGDIPPVAAVCVWSRHVALAKGLVGRGIRVATVINFPTGDASLEAVLEEARQGLGNGADELDLVIPYKTFLTGDTRTAATMIARVRALLPPGRRLKVILETGAYPDAAAIRAASDMAIGSGADFIKTSTGKIARGASPEAAQVMLEAIRASGRPVGFKPSGGIRTAQDAAAYLALADRILGSEWATPATFRFGASGLWDALAGMITGRDSRSEQGY